MEYIKITPVDKWIIDPVNRFISKSSTGGLVLILSAVFAIILANSPWSHWYHEIWHYPVSLTFGDDINLSMSLHHWINDGLMAIFFFVIGLELKREIVAGELSNPRNAILPIVAGIGGMVFPALIYTYFNQGQESMNGWGIPMATDLAFALGILYLLGDRIPASLKIFLTAFAIVDDLGSVLVIALFYTSEISMQNLGIGLSFLAAMILSNWLGVRNMFYYGLLGIGGVWLFFLLSGVHATIAAILAAFAIPASTKINEKYFIDKMKHYLEKFRKSDIDDSVPTLTSEQLHLLDDMESLTHKAMTPLQKLEHEMHPIVAFVVMPIFALANAGVTFSSNFMVDATSSVALGVAVGLIVGKMIGIFGVPALMVRLKLVSIPTGTNYKFLFGLGMLSAIGFTMSLFINDLAFTPLGEIGKNYITQAKIGIIIASVIGGFSGYFFLRSVGKKEIPVETEE
ncbi:MAG TPA: Na+/H+ antiporter NhaA [Flavobacteriales bacterium]